MKYLVGSVTSTRPDKYGTAFSKEALFDGATQINKKYIPLTLEHERSNIIGVVLYAEVHELLKNEWFLMNVSGVFEDGDNQELYKAGLPNQESSKPKYSKLIADQLDKYRILLENTPISNYKFPDTLEEQIEQYLDRTKVDENGNIYEIRAFIASIGDLKIEIFPNDHNPPHFHVTSKQRGINARFNLSTLKFIDYKKGTRGELKSNDIKKLENFFKTTPSVKKELKKRYKEFSQNN